jgi:hypothetical protein
LRGFAFRDEAPVGDVELAIAKGIDDASELPAGPE